MGGKERRLFGECALGGDIQCLRHALRLSSSALVFSLVASSGTQAQQPTPLPEVDVIAPAPLASPRKPPPKRTQPARSTTSQAAPAQPAAAPAAADSGGIARDKVPSNTQVLTSADFSHTQSSNVLDALSQNIAGAALSDQSGNAFQRNLDYRGFTASPVPGTPEGLAVYQNGVRINESFGDVVNWDFIPEMAINRAVLVPNNPTYGLNAIGGALSLEMKNGFTYQDKEVEATVGSYGRIQGGVQVGFQGGPLSGYIAADATHDDGWRDFSSSSDLRRMYVDLGTRGDPR